MTMLLRYLVVIVCFCVAVIQCEIDQPPPFDLEDLIGGNLDNLPPELQAPPTSGNIDLANDDTPGQPLTPDDFRAADTLADDEGNFVYDDSADDPITRAGK